MKEHDCEIVQERLEGLGGAPPSGDRLQELERLAAGCSDCETILAAYLHLAGSSAEELEAEVPPEMAGSMWSRVSKQTVELSSGRRQWSLGRILTPALAAAVVLLVFALGFMLGELRHLRGIEERMARMIERREETIAVMQARRTDAAPGLFASERFRDFARRRLLNERESYRVGEIISLLERLPRDTQVLSAREVDVLLARSGAAAYTPYYSKIRGFDYSNGIDAGEALMLIEALGIDADQLIPREEIASLRGI